jgi:hypothetical protein
MKRAVGFIGWLGLFHKLPPPRLHLASLKVLDQLMQA